MSAKKQEENKGLWPKYMYYIVGTLGAILLVLSMGVQTVVLNYKTEDGTQYAVKMDYSAVGICLDCKATTKNAGDIVEKAIFFGSGKEKSVGKAAKGLQEIAETEEGIFQIRVSGLIGNNEKNTQNLIQYLESIGYDAETLG